MTELQIALIWSLLGAVGSILGIIVDYFRYQEITLKYLVGALVAALIGGPVLLILGLVDIISIFPTIVVFKRK